MRALIIIDADLSEESSTFSFAKAETKIGVADQ